VARAVQAAGSIVLARNYFIIAAYDKGKDLRSLREEERVIDHCCTVTTVTCGGT